MLYFASDLEQTQKVTNGKSRQAIWFSPLHDKDMNIGVYQPEDDDYEVLSVDLGINMCVETEFNKILFMFRRYSTAVLCQ